MHGAVNVIAGIVLLLAGRKLFWLFVGLVGFFVGFEVARVLMADQPQWLVWLVAVAAGLIGAIVAMLFERVAFALAGFYAGAYLALLAAERFVPGGVRHRRVHRRRSAGCDRRRARHGPGHHRSVEPGGRGAGHIVAGPGKPRQSARLRRSRGDRDRRAGEARARTPTR